MFLDLVEEVDLTINPLLFLHGVAPISHDVASDRVVLVHVRVSAACYRSRSVNRCSSLSGGSFPRSIETRISKRPGVRPEGSSKDQ